MGMLIAHPPACSLPGDVLTHTWRMAPRSCPACSTMETLNPNLRLWQVIKKTLNPKAALFPPFVALLFEWVGILEVTPPPHAPCTACAVGSL